MSKNFARSKIFLLSTMSLVLSLVLPSTSALAADASAEPVNNNVEKITITGSKRTNERMRLMLDFVNKLSLPVDGSGYARLEEAPCALIKNLTQLEADYLGERLQAAAQEAGLTAAKPGCAPNIVIFFTADGKAMADYLVKNHLEAIKPYGNVGGTTQDSHALHDFVTSDVPIRWWQITMPVDQSGISALPNDLLGNVDTENPLANVTILEGTESRLIRPVRDRLLSSLIIVDVKRVGDTTWDQLADYLAMVSLVQVKPRHNLAGFDSILNLFSANATSVPPSLSDWDKAYLRGLYGVNRYLQPWSQARALAGHVLDNLYK